jgi:hypothetical protein
MISFWAIFGYLSLFFASLISPVKWDAETLTLEPPTSPVAAAHVRVDRFTPYGNVSYETEVRTSGTLAKAKAELRDYRMREPKDRTPPELPVLQFSVEPDGRMKSPELPMPFPFDPVILLRRRPLTLRRDVPEKFHLQKKGYALEGTVVYRAPKPDEAEVVVRGEGAIQGNKIKLEGTFRFDRKAGRLASAEYHVIDLRSPNAVPGQRQGLHVTVKRL